MNPALIRTGVYLWWHDCSARALGEEFKQLTFSLTNAASINRLDASGLRSGDLAVTEDGIHVLAFLGDAHWIEADPDGKQVLIIEVPSTNSWFGVPVKLVRWSQLR